MRGTVRASRNISRFYVIDHVTGQIVSGTRPRYSSYESTIVYQSIIRVGRDRVYPPFTGGRNESFILARHLLRRSSVPSDHYYRCMAKRFCQFYKSIMQIGHNISEYTYYVRRRSITSFFLSLFFFSFFSLFSFFLNCHTHSSHYPVQITDREPYRDDCIRDTPASIYFLPCYCYCVSFAMPVKLNPLFPPMAENSRDTLSGKIKKKCFSGHGKFFCRKEKYTQKLERSNNPAPRNWQRRWDQRKYHASELFIIMRIFHRKLTLIKSHAS